MSAPNASAPTNANNAQAPAGPMPSAQVLVQLLDDARLLDFLHRVFERDLEVVRRHRLRFFWSRCMARVFI